MVQNLAISIPSISVESSSVSGSGSGSGTASTVSEISESESVSFADVPLTALSRKTRRQLSNLLNAKKILRSEEGYERDWRGIASLAQQKSICDESTLGGDDPMSKVLLMWCSNNPCSATLAHLEKFLGIIDRWDVCDDIYENLVADAKCYNAGQQQQLQQPSLAIVNVSMAPDVARSEIDAGCSSIGRLDNFGNGSDANILTKDDVLRAQQGLPPQRYDAFVLFADADINYAVEMLTKLEESTEYNFKLCIKDRDLLAGISFTHVALTQLIEERCKHLIVILTSEFMKSPENKFLVNYTQALQIQHKTRKIIPLLYEELVVIPRTLKIYTHLKYNPNAGGLYDFWGKLAASIRDVNISAVSTDSVPAVYTANGYSVPARSHRLAAATPINGVYRPLKLAKPPTSTELPSININGQTLLTTQEDDVPKKKERNRFKKRSSLRTTNVCTNASPHIINGEPQLLRNAHSTSQLNASAGTCDTHLSTSDLSTMSGCSETKKKRKWPGKLLKKVFSRSTTKLQEPV